MSEGAEEEAVDQPMELIDQTKKERRERPWQTYTVDGHPVRARQPKSAFFVHIAKMETGTDAEKVRAVDTLIDRVFDKDSATWLHDRLDDDDDDDFDIDEAADLINRLVEVWSPGRPTGSSRGSARRSPSTRKRSTARSR